MALAYNENNGEDEKMNLKRVLAFTLSAAALALSGCGGSTSSSTPSTDASASTPTSSAASNEAQTPAGGTAASGKLVVGMECNYPPFNWTQPSATDTSVALGDGVSYADGYDIMMSKTIADALGLELEIKKIAWEGLEPALNSGEIDAIIAGMTATEERRQNADFTEPYYASDMVIIVRGDDAELTNITNIQQLSGKRVQGQINTNYDIIIDQIEGVDHATPLASYPLMVMALQSGDVDALTAELPVATGVVAANPDLKIVKFTEGNGFDIDTTVSVAVKKGNTELLDSINGVLATIDGDTRLQWMTDAVNRQPAVE